MESPEYIQVTVKGVNPRVFNTMNFPSYKNEKGVMRRWTNSLGEYVDVGPFLSSITTLLNISDNVEHQKLYEWLLSHPIAKKRLEIRDLSADEKIRQKKNLMRGRVIQKIMGLDIDKLEMICELEGRDISTDLMPDMQAFLVSVVTDDSSVRRLQKRIDESNSETEVWAKRAEKLKIIWKNGARYMMGDKADAEIIGLNFGQVIDFLNENVSVLNQIKAAWTTRKVGGYPVEEPKPQIDIYTDFEDLSWDELKVQYKERYGKFPARMSREDVIDKIVTTEA